MFAGCVAVSLAVELTARIGFDRVSKIQRRMADEYQLATTIGTDRLTGRRHVLVVGNSLLNADVRFDWVRDALGSQCDTRRFVIEQTSYVDWYYGLKRLFRRGARPDVVVVMLSTGQWTGTAIRGDYSAQYLIDMADLPAVSRDLGLNPTQATNLAFSSVSKFWGVRAEIRNFVLGHLMPDLGQLMSFSSIVDRNPILDDNVARIAHARIVRLKALTDMHGAKLVLVLPPIIAVQDGAAGFLRAGSAAGVTTLRPVASGTLALRLYQDAGFHLNQTGADEFTNRLIPMLRAELATPAARTVTASVVRQRDSRPPQ